jgi:hypothetical protein
MSRGPGRCQRAILEALGRTPLVGLRGRSRAERVALARAARALERAGLCVVVRLWDHDGRNVRPYAARPDFTVNGGPVKELSVARVPYGTGATFTYVGSLRHVARQEGISKTQVVRDLAKAERSGKGGRAAVPPPAPCRPTVTRQGTTTLCPSPSRYLPARQGDKA